MGVQQLFTNRTYSNILKYLFNTQLNSHDAWPGWYLLGELLLIYRVYCVGVRASARLAGGRKDQRVPVTVHPGSPDPCPSARPAHSYVNQTGCSHWRVYHTFCRGFVSLCYTLSNFTIRVGEKWLVLDELDEMFYGVRICTSNHGYYDC